MSEQDTLQRLLELAEEAGLTVRVIPSHRDSSEGSAGALVRLRGKEILFLDSAAAPPLQIRVVADALRGRAGLEDRYLRPDVRAALEGEH